MIPHFDSVFEVIKLKVKLKVVISGKVTSLPKVIKYVKRSKYPFHDFRAYAKFYFITNKFIIVEC